MQEKIAIDRREVLRYLGYHGNEADERTVELIEEAVHLLQEQARPAHIWREFPLKLGAGGEIDGGCFRTVSQNLSRNLKDCERLLLFAATLGLGVDYLIQRYTRLQMSMAVVLQAAGAAMIEAYCDEVCAGLKEDFSQKGWYARPRFSPGYGDFSLGCQREILGGLEAGKRIGITLTDSLLMMPSKSVSAVIGLGKKPWLCEVKGCEACGKKDCPYRR